MKNFDIKYLGDKYALLAGTDEAGRGPLAGPVVAAAVIFDRATEIIGIDDSKKLNEKKREILFNEIIERALTFSINSIPNEEIDRINILRSSLKAMQISVSKLTHNPEIILVDGNFIFPSESLIFAVVKGDAKSHSIAAASILAKVTRDRIMTELDKQFPMYKWKDNKGYPTKEHFEAIKKYGITPYHRKTFLRKFEEKNEIRLFEC